MSPTGTEAQNIKLLRGCALFESLDERDMLELARICRSR